MEELLDYEKRHIGYLRENAHEGTLFLKRDESFPIDKPCKAVLVGSGARQTIKGGTGSGDVTSRFFVNFEKGMENAGFEITSKEWMDRYDEFRRSTFRQYVKDTKKLASQNYLFAGVYSMGFFEEEKNYDFEPDYEGDICVYVLARNSGEGNDRRNIKGDVQLSDREVKDILHLNQKFGKFLLVLNVGGVVDLTPVVNEVRNILYISQLGVVTGSILPDIILGKANPSGKLTTTWAKTGDYPFFEEFGDLHDTYYKEGVYVGYRYFDSAKKTPYFPFGFGLSYTSFSISEEKVSSDKDTVTVSAKVMNTGKKEGKEVVQVYVSAPQGRLIKPYQSLVSYQKTALLKPGESQEVSLSFAMEDLTCYDEKKASYVLEKGDYIVRVGSSSRDTKAVSCLRLTEEINVRECQNRMGKPGFEDYSLPQGTEEHEDLPVIAIDPADIQKSVITYQKDTYTDPVIEKLSDDELILLTLGTHKTSRGSTVGNSSVHVVGGAGETALGISSIQESLTMADGPAGLRLTQVYGVDKKGAYPISVDPIFTKMFHFLPGFVSFFMMPPRHRHGEVHYQYTTAIPIGTSLAMSFNDEYLYHIGEIVAEEMETFHVDLWLAPALNIHRNILCGRNFEYYSEDPFVSGKTAAMITKGVQSHKGKGVTVKHFCCNNQELNRNNNNSHVSERALREIYLRGFEICLKESSPKALMTSYNLINGTHTSESYELINDILRCEWGYQGLVMTDWITSGNSWCSKSRYPAPYADNNVLAGNDLTMAGCKKDEKCLAKALKKGKITRDDLIHSGSRIYRSILLQKK